MMDVVLKVGLLVCGLLLLAPGFNCEIACGEDEEPRNETCWYFSNVSMSWQRAIAACLSRGMIMALTDNSADNTFVAKMIKEKEVGQGWLGATRESEGGTFTSVPADAELAFDNWDTGLGQPDNKKGNELCVAIHEDSKWHDYQCCDGNKAAVCVKA